MTKRILGGLTLALILIAASVPSQAAERQGKDTPKKAALHQPSKGKAEEILNRVMKAMGGEKAIEGIKNMVIDLEVTMKGPQGDMAMSITQYQIFPSRIRQEISSPYGRMVQVFDGERGWMEGPQGVMDLPPQQVEQLKGQTSRDRLNLLKEWKEGKINVEVLPSEDFQGKKTFILLLQFPPDSSDGSEAMESLKVYVDPSTYQIIGQSHFAESQMGQGEVVVSFSDYKKVKGISFPFKGITTFNGGELSQFKITNLEVNTEIDPSLFEK